MDKVHGVIKGYYFKQTENTCKEVITVVFSVVAAILSIV